MYLFDYDELFAQGDRWGVGDRI